MKKIILITGLVSSFISVSAQYGEPSPIIEAAGIIDSTVGLCNNNEVYYLTQQLDESQIIPKAPLVDEEIENKINKELIFLKENPKFKFKGSANLLINCKGELIKCTIENTINKTFENQLIDLLKSLGLWSPGENNFRKVDSYLFFHFTIKKGVFKVGK